MTDRAIAAESALHATMEIVTEINQIHGLRYMLGARCSGGLQGGAWMLDDPDGRQAVLKWRPDDPASRRVQLLPVVNRIRSTGYPTPRWIAAGVTASGASYHLQERVPGHPGALLTTSSAMLMVEVIEKQTGLAPDPAADWSRYVSGCALEEDDNGPRRFLRNLGQPGTDLLTHFDQILTAPGPVQLPGGDMVHGDFNSCNVMLHQGQVSGIIDIEALGSGTRAIDYGWLLREIYATDAGQDAARVVRRAGEAVAGPAVFATCVAATTFDIVRFQARHGRANDLPRLLANFHRLADDLAVPVS